MNKILFLLHFPPPVHGSSVVGKYVKESSVINNKFQCRFINLLASNELANSGKINIHKIIGFFVTIAKLLVSISRNRPQLCYMALTARGAAFYKDLILVVLLKLFRIKLVYHLHNKGISLKQEQIINRICYGYVFNKAEVILLSERLYDDIKPFVPKDRVHICPNGIMEPVVVDQCGLQKTTNIVRILFLSNLIESKGVFVLLEAMTILNRKGIIFEGVFIGGEVDVPVSRFNEKVQQLGISNLVFYQGAKYGKAKEKAISEADIFVFPTYYEYETFGLVLLEAMRYSLPVVSTFEGGIPDIVEDGVSGFLVPQRNVELLAEKLEILIINPELRLQMGEAGRKKYEKEFTSEIFERRLTAILHEIIEQ